jgi:hypothetical protein
MEQYLVMGPTDDQRPRYKVYIGLSEKFEPVHRECFVDFRARGFKSFS